MHASEQHVKTVTEKPRSPATTMNPPCDSEKRKENGREGWGGRKGRREGGREEESMRYEGI